MSGPEKKDRAKPSSLMTVTDVSEFLRIHRLTVYRLIKTRQIPCFRIGRDFRFNREQIDAWCKAQEQLSHRSKPSG
jgi:excisionase family DNA binding protein